MRLQAERRQAELAAKEKDRTEQMEKKVHVFVCIFAWLFLEQNDGMDLCAKEYPTPDGL